MAEVPSSLRQEQARLARVVTEIEKQLDDIRQVVDERKSGVLAGRKEMWQDLPHQIHSFDDMVLMSQHALVLGEQERDHALYQRILNNLERMYRSPYFGRVDFKDSEYPTVEPIYIGISSLVDSKSGEHLVYDWRAPVSSMFYDAEPGPASYVADVGVIEGELLLKRQYSIEKGKLLYYFDTSLKIDDDVLQEVLAKHVDDKMRHIVTSIQREQNLIIRDEKHNVLVVQGPAGSGKTSIALHRAAYLLYRYRGKLSAENLVIFSPNDVFSDYISNVLPELGEEPINQVTFIEYARKQLGSGLRLEAMEDQMEYLLTQRGNPRYNIRVAGIKFKASVAFLKLIQSYVAHLESGGMLRLSDIHFGGKLIMDQAEMLDRLRNRYNDMPYSKRLGMLHRRIQFLLEEPLKDAVGKVAEELAADPEAVGLSSKEIKRRSRRIVNAELRSTMERIDAWKNVDMYNLYLELFRNRKLFDKVSRGIELPEEMERIRKETVHRLESRQLAFEDVAPLMYFGLLIEGAPAAQQPIRHVIVDEAQDYSVFHYEVMQRLFPQSSFTILGDMNQSVHPYMNTGTYDAILDVFAERDPHLIRLQRTYRSTAQISRFTRAILPGSDDVELIDRDGPRPRVVKVSESDRAVQIANEVARMQEEGAGSVALVCKTAAEAAALYAQLREKLEVLLLQKDDHVFRTGVIIVPVYLAKGLEFDGVIICEASAETYAHETERKAFYTACTRALHHLTLFHAGAVSPFIAQMDAGLYEKIG